jgi:ABC-type multidrug transport system ATPase subunit
MNQGTLEVNIFSLSVKGSFFWNKPKVLLNHPEGVTFEVKKGEMTLLRGNNGTGKSTLITSLFGESRKILEGKIFVNKREKSPKDTANYLAYLPQENSTRYQKDATVLDYIKWSLTNWKNSNQDDEKIKDKLKEFFVNEYDEIVGKVFKKLSNGQQKIVRTIATLLSNKDYYVFDEPLNHLDNDKSEKLMKEFDKKMEEGKGIIVISHCMIYLRPNKVYIIREKKLLVDQLSVDNNPCSCKKLVQ